VKWAKYIIGNWTSISSIEGEKGFDSFHLPDISIVITGGDCKLSVSAQDSIPYDTGNLDSQYPAGFRIPPNTLTGIEESERILLSQQFALASALYLVMVGKPPFAGLDDSLVQQNFDKGIFPSDTMDFPIKIAVPVLGFWSQRFAREFIDVFGNKDNKNFFGKAIAHVKANPVSSGFSIAGFVVLTAASLVIPGLAAAGFAASGPVAGSAAAAMQSGIGLVRAGSFFAWCQSAAMGGAAAGTIVGAQVVGASAAGLGILASVKRDGEELDEAVMKEVIWALFMANVRKVVENNRA